MTIRLSNRQLVMLRFIVNEERVMIEAARSFNQLTLASLYTRGLISINSRYIDITNNGLDVIQAFRNTVIRRKNETAPLSKIFSLRKVISIRRAS